MLMFNKVTFNVTRNCNLACSYCFSGHCNQKFETMSMDTARKCVDFLISHAQNFDPKYFQNNKKTIEIIFWGGEPLLAWDTIKEITLYAESVTPKDIEVIFKGTTNGTLLTEDKFDFLQEHKIYFMVSIDGTAETQNMYRKFANGKGSHKTIVDNIKKYIKVFPNVPLRQSTIPERIDHFYEDLSYLIDLGANEIVYSPVFELEWTKKHWDIFEEQGMKLVDLVKKYSEQGRHVKISRFFNACTPRKGKANGFECGSGKSYFGFDIDGSIWPCHRFVKFDDKRPWQEKETCVGHVDVGITRPEFLEQFSKTTNNEKCLNCEYLKSEFLGCNGCCYAQNFEQTGNIFDHANKTCVYISKERKIADYCMENGLYDQRKPKVEGGCVCFNTCYLEGTPNEIFRKDESILLACYCHVTDYTSFNEKYAVKKLQKTQKADNKLDDAMKKLDKIMSKVL